MKVALKCRIKLVEYRSSHRELHTIDQFINLNVKVLLNATSTVQRMEQKSSIAIQICKRALSRRLTHFVPLRALGCPHISPSQYITYSFMASFSHLIIQISRYKPRHHNSHNPHKHSLKNIRRPPHPTSLIYTPFILTAAITSRRTRSTAGIYCTSVSFIILARVISIFLPFRDILFVLFLIYAHGFGLSFPVFDPL